MSLVDPTFAEWLQAESLPSRAVNATMATRWGDSALESTVTSGLALKFGGDAESARQLAFLAFPLVEDEHTVIGLQRDKLGQVVTISAPWLGYAAGVDVFVIAVKEDHSARMTTLTVLRRLETPSGGVTPASVTFDSTSGFSFDSTVSPTFDRAA